MINFLLGAAFTFIIFKFVKLINTRSFRKKLVIFWKQHRVLRGMFIVFALIVITPFLFIGESFKALVLDRNKEIKTYNTYGDLLKSYKLYIKDLIQTI